MGFTFEVLVYGEKDKKHRNIKRNWLWKKRVVLMRKLFDKQYNINDINLTKSIDYLNAL